MKIIPKLTLALVGGTCAVLAVNGYLRVQRERTYFEADRLRDRELIGRSLCAAAAAIWESDGQDAAVRTIDAANTPFTAIHVQWLASDALALKHDQGAVSAIAMNRALTRTERGQNGLVWKTDVPLEVDGVPRGVIELSEVAAAERRFVRNAIEDTAVLATALALVSALLSFAMSQWLVGAPVRALSEKARRVGRGQFSGTVVLPQRDELGDLAREMNGMANRLAATMHQLRHADRLATVGTLASGVAHELGTPLNVVSARATMIATGEANAEESKDYARVIVGAADRMTGTIRRLLQFARREGLQTATCDMRALVKESLELLQPLARKRSVTLEVVAAGDDARANVDAGQIQQVIANLVMNAIQAMSGGGTVMVTIGRGRSLPPADIGGAEADVLWVRVKDDGDGIAPAQLPHIFEPFFTTKDVGEGTGLGLAVTYGIIREHGGWITVESRPREGSTFSVFLPIQGDA